MRKIHKIITKIIKHCLHFWFPHSCLLCYTQSTQETGLCRACENDLPYIRHACMKCGRIIPKQTNICGDCLKHTPPFEKTFALCQYKEPIIKLITNLKFNHQLKNAHTLGLLIAKSLFTQPTESLPDSLIPVPLHKKRLKERGFNQSHEIARIISTKLRIPIDIKSCIRIKNTQAQTLVPAKERHNNIKNAFLVKESFNTRHVAIIDDVVTTGNTMTELTRALKKAGAERVEIWCCARAQK